MIMDMITSLCNGIVAACTAILEFISSLFQATPPNITG